MAIFDYQALTPSGRLMKGTLEAPSHDAAGQLLAEMGLTVHALAAAGRQSPASRIGRHEFLLFNQQLASITKAGIPLERGLRELAAEIDSSAMRKLVLAIADDLEAGVSLEDAFEKRRSLFPPLYGQIVRAGVQSGRLSDMLTSLNHHLEMTSLTRRILFESISYPAVVFTLAAIIVSGVAVGLVPAFRNIFADMGEKLPAITRAFMAMSEHVWSFWAGVAVVIASLMLISLSMSASSAGRQLRERIRMKVPVLGRLYHRSMLCRLADAMALLVGSGADLPSCLRLGSGASGSEVLKVQCDRLAQAVERGESIVEAGHYAPIVPPLFLYSMQFGSQRNELQDNLYSLSDMYAQQVSTNQSRLQALLMPLMLIFVGGFVALCVTAMFMPMVTMLNAVSK